MNIWTWLRCLSVSVCLFIDQLLPQSVSDSALLKVTNQNKSDMLRPEGLEYLMFSSNTTFYYQAEK